jgi:exonuclease III
MGKRTTPIGRKTTPRKRLRPELKISTYNVNSINGRLPVLLRWLDEAKPHIVCLQELKAPNEKFPEKELLKAEYGSVWHGQKSWNGVAILARNAEPVEYDVACLMTPTIRIAVTSKRPSPDFLSDAFTFPTVTPC